MENWYSRRTILVGSYALFALCFLGYPLAGSLLMIGVVLTLHGAPFGLATVSNNTVAVDFLPYSRRAEGVAYYGLSNNLAMAIAPVVGLEIYGYFRGFGGLMWGAVGIAAAGLVLTISTRLPRARDTNASHFSCATFCFGKAGAMALL